MSALKYLIRNIIKLDYLTNPKTVPEIMFPNRQMRRRVPTARQIKNLQKFFNLTCVYQTRYHHQSYQTTNATAVTAIHSRYSICSFLVLTTRLVQDAELPIIIFHTTVLRKQHACRHVSIPTPERMRVTTRALSPRPTHVFRGCSISDLVSNRLESHTAYVGQEDRREGGYVEFISIPANIIQGAERSNKSLRKSQFFCLLVR